MVEEARFRDQRSFGSDGNHAQALGVCRRTVIRWKKQLEDEGKIIRCGWHSWGVGKRTVVYRFDGAPPQKESCGSTGTSEPVRRRPCAKNVTQRLRRSTPTPSGLGTNRYGRTNAFGCATKRREMDEFEVAEQAAMGSQHDAYLDRQPSAQEVIANVVDTFSEKGIPIPSRHKGIIGKQAKELLADGFDVSTLTIAAVVALKRGEPQNMHFVASDLVMARAGQKLSRSEYERMLRDEMEIGGFK